MDLLLYLFLTLLAKACFKSKIFGFLANFLESCLLKGLFLDSS